MTISISDAGIQFADNSIQIGAANVPIPFAVSVTTGALTVAISQTGAVTANNSGTVVRTNVPSGATITLPALASLGSLTTIPSRILLLWSFANNSLMVGNISGGFNFDETNTIGPTIISSSSTAANLVYSAAGTSSTLYKIIGYFDAVWTSGTGWATPSNIVTISASMSLAAMTSIGYGQTWQTPTRTAGTTYYNTTGRPIQVIGSFGHPSAYVQTTAIVGGLTIATYYNITPGGAQIQGATVSFIVPPGFSYSISSNGYQYGWSELR